MSEAAVSTLKGKTAVSPQATYETLQADDFWDLLDFLSVAFVAEDFRQLLPRLYRPHLAGLNLVAKQDERIVSCAMLVPHTWHVGDVTLRVAGFGGVSTHPRSRGQGLMQETLGRQLLRLDDFDLAFLGGERQRYNRFGFEHCGCAIRFVFNKKNIREKAETEPRVTFRKLEDHDAASLAKVMALHGRQPLRVDRGHDPMEFYLYLCSWGHRPYVAEDERGEVKGLFVVDGGPHASKVHVTELLAESPDVACAMVTAWLRGHDALTELALTMSPTEPLLVQKLASWAERSQVEPIAHAEMFRVVAWDRVVDALLKLKLRLVGHLTAAVIVLHIFGHCRLQLSVADDGLSASCKQLLGTEASAPLASTDVECDQSIACRLLFGSLPPTHVMPLPPKVAAVLCGWCPLPLFWSPQDAV